MKDEFGSRAVETPRTIAHLTLREVSTSLSSDVERGTQSDLRTSSRHGLPDSASGQAGCSVAPMGARYARSRSARSVAADDLSPSLERQLADGIVIALVGSKGGSTKTSATATLTHVYAERGYHCVMVDLDPQGTLTLRCGERRVANPLVEPPVTIEYVVPGAGEDDGVSLVVPVSGTVTLYRGGRSLDGASAEAIDAYLRRILDECASQPSGDGVSRFVIIDTPPALGPLTLTAMRHASVIIVPSEATREGVDSVVDVLALHRHLGIAAPVRVLFSRLLGLTRELAAWARQEIHQIEARQHDHAGGQPTLKLKAEIPFTRAGGFAAAFEVPVTVSARADRSSVAWRAVATEIVRDVLHRPIRQRRVRPKTASAMSPEVTA